MQPPDEAHEAGAAVGVEARGGFVEQQQLGLQGQRPRQRHPLDHPARQLGRHAQGHLGAELDHRQLEQHQVAQHVLVADAELAQRKRHVGEHVERREQRPLLEQHAKAPPPGELVGAATAKQGLAEQPHLALGRLQKAHHLPQQGGLAGAGAAHQRHHLARRNGPVDAPMHPGLPETGRHAAEFDGVGHHAALSAATRCCGSRSRTRHPPGSPR